MVLEKTDMLLFYCNTDKRRWLINALSLKMPCLLWLYMVEYSISSNIVTICRVNNH